MKREKLMLARATSPDTELPVEPEGDGGAAAPPAAVGLPPWP